MTTDQELKEIPENFPTFVTNVPDDSFSFDNLIFQTSGYPVKFVRGAVDVNKKPLPDYFKVVTDTEENSQRLHLLYQHANQYSTLTVVLNEGVGQGNASLILNLLNNENMFYQIYHPEIKRNIERDTLKRCFMRAVQRSFKDRSMFEEEMEIEEDSGYERYDDDIRAYKLFQQEGQEPISLSDIKALLSEDIPGIKSKVEDTIKLYREMKKLPKI